MLRSGEFQDLIFGHSKKRQFFVPFFFWKDYEDEVKDRSKLIQKNYLEHGDMYATIWGSLSTASRGKIRQHKDFSKAEFDDIGIPDPLVLWNIIIKTHLEPYRGNSIIDRHQGRRMYENIRQYPDELLPDFLLRFENCFEALARL